MGVSYKGFGDGGGSKIQGLVIYPPAAMAAKYNSPPNWNTAAGSLGAANGGVAYTFNLSASDPQNQVLTYTLQSGSLPVGLSLSSAGAITGTPTNIPGTSNFIVRVSDGEFYTDRTFSLDVTNQTPIWQTAGGALTAGTRGTSYTTTFIATDPNNDVVTYSVVSGSLPSGLTLNSSTGELSGTPTTGNSYSFTIRATDALSAYVDRAFSLVIEVPTFRFLNLYITGTNGDGFLEIDSIKWVTSTGNVPSVNMTAYNQPTPLVATASSEYPHTPAFLVYSSLSSATVGLPGGDGLSRWHSTTTTMPAWIKLDLGNGNGIAPTGVSITPFQGAAGLRTPKDFQILGSNTGLFSGEETVIASYTSVTTGWTHLVPKTFNF